MKRLFLYGQLRCGADASCAGLCHLLQSRLVFVSDVRAGAMNAWTGEYGRVGSIFSDPTAVAGAPAPRQSGEPVQILPDNSSPAEELELPAPRGNSIPPVNPPQTSGGGTSTGSSSSHPTRSGRTRWR